MKHSLFTLGIVAASLSVATLSCTTQQQPTEVTWGTFNIRYDNPGDSLNNWQYRKDNVAQFIKSQDIDIVGMQEVLHNQLEDLKSRLCSGCRGTSGRPACNKNCGEQHGRGH